MGQQMIPDTELYLRRKLMFLLIGRTYYNVCNANDVDRNYLTLCGLKFPLMNGRSLSEEEYGYEKKNVHTIEEFKDNLERKVSTGKEFTHEIVADINKKKDILFFLNEICAKHARNPFTYQEIDGMQLDPFYSAEKGAIYPKIIRKDYAAINGRLYPLMSSKLPVFGSLEGQNYTLLAGETTINDVNSSFKQMFIQKLTSEVLQRCDSVKESEKERQQLNNYIAAYANTLNILVRPHAFEWNNDANIIGYDFTSKLLYCLIEPHYNHTTAKTYVEGQSAATLSLEKRIVGDTGKFAERNDHNSPFIISSASHCLGDLALRGQTLAHKLVYLKEFAHEVMTNQAFYQISTSSDSSDYQGY